MIRNEQEYRLTKAQIENFERTLMMLTSETPSILEKAQTDALRSQLNDLRQQLQEAEMAYNTRG